MMKMNKYCQDGGSKHTFDEYDVCFECGAKKPETKQQRYTKKQITQGRKQRMWWLTETETQKVREVIKTMREKIT